MTNGLLDELVELLFNELKLNKPCPGFASVARLALELLAPGVIGGRLNWEAIGDPLFPGVWTCSEEAAEPNSDEEAVCRGGVA